MYLKVKGLDELIKKFENFENDPSFQKAMRDAVNGGAKIVADEVQKSLETTKDKGYSKGYTAKEINITKVTHNSKGYFAKINWKGPHDRYKIVHLNEFGYSRGGKSYSPPMKGKISLGVKNSQDEFEDYVTKKIKEGVNKIGK